jgi:hypothetical protein
MAGVCLIGWDGVQVDGAGYSTDKATVLRMHGILHEAIKRRYFNMC